MRWLIFALASFGATRQSAADPAAEGLWRYHPTGDWAVDAGLVAGSPAALSTGLALGAGAGVSRTAGPVVLGARAAWATATESSMAWIVTHRDLRLRATGGIVHAAGRGAIGLRLGLGGTLVHEVRLRSQGERAGLTGEALRTSSLALLPAADLEATVSLQLWGAWRVDVSGGPTITIDDGRALVGWTAGLGVGWRP